jgi:tetratricopeptide (TPR) repeat protein
MSSRFLRLGWGAVFVLLGAALTFPLQKQESQKTAGPPPQSVEAKKRKRLVADLSGFELLDSSKARKERTMVGATRGLAQAPTALAPELGKFYGAGALFAWSTKGKAKSFVLVFTDQTGAEAYRAEVSGAEYRYLSDAAHLQPGKTYFWMVQVNPPLFGANPSEPAGFVVVSDSERTEIEKALANLPKGDPYKTALARAKLFTEHRLWYDALGAYTDAIARYPDHAELYEQRGMIYAQLEATREQAEEDFARADELKAGK